MTDHDTNTNLRADSARTADSAHPSQPSEMRTAEQPPTESGPGIPPIRIENALGFGAIPRPPQRPTGPPTRDRKLKHLSDKQVEAARALVKPQPPPKRGNKIKFEPDHTPADAEEILATQARPATRPPPSARAVHHGPLPKSAPADEQATREQIRAAQAEISPFAPPPDPSCNGEGPPGAGSPELTDPELQQIIQLVQNKYGPILSMDQASEISKLAKQTIRERVCRGEYAGSVVRGRPLRFWAHRFVQEVMR